MTELLPWLTIAGFALTIGTMLVKHGMDKAFVKAGYDALQKDIERLEKLIEADRAHNLKQHEEFYSNRNDTIELKTDMKYIKKTMENIENMLSTIQREGFVDRRRGE